VTSLSKNARVAGLLYILASAVGIVRLLYVPKALIVAGNATVTADNIVAHEMFFRIGIVSTLVGGVLWLFVPLALYRLLKGVDQTLAVLMVILGGLMQTPIIAINTVTDAAALMLARGADFLSVVDKPQRDALAMLFLNLHHQLDLANSVFFGTVAGSIWPAGVQIAHPTSLPRRVASVGVFRLAGVLLYRLPLPGLRGQGV
jgi:hypothetical protein